MKLIITLIKNDMERLLRRETVSINNPSGSVEISIAPDLSNDDVLEIFDELGEHLPISQGHQA